MLQRKNDKFGFFSMTFFAVLFSMQVFSQGGLPGGDLGAPGDWPASCDTVTCPANYACVDGVCVCNNWGDCGPCGGYDFYPYQSCNIPLDNNIILLLGCGVFLWVGMSYRTFGRR